MTTPIPSCEFPSTDVVRKLRDDELRELGWLSLGVAHDLNNLLTVIVGAATMASDTTGSHIKQEMDTINAACLRARELLQGLTRLGMAHPIQDRVVDLNRMTRDVLKLITHVPHSRVGFLLDLTPDGAPIFGDETGLKCALINILINALDAMPMGGSITLRTRNEDFNRISLTVHDTGEGMSPETLARATEPFFSTKALGNGSGLGLARVRETVEAHDGTLSIASEEGLGSTIRIEFPCAHWDSCTEQPSFEEAVSARATLSTIGKANS
jgi:signal transduction histidine kinase